MAEPDDLLFGVCS